MRTALAVALALLFAALAVFGVGLLWLVLVARLLQLRAGY